MSVGGWEVLSPPQLIVEKKGKKRIEKETIVFRFFRESGLGLAPVKSPDKGHSLAMPGLRSRSAAQCSLSHKTKESCDSGRLG